MIKECFIVQCDSVIAVEGMALARPFILNQNKLQISKETNKDHEAQLQVLEDGISKCSEKLLYLMENTHHISKEYLEILDFQLLMLEDDEFLSDIRTYIINENCNAEYAVQVVSDLYANKFAALDNDYLRERFSDVLDLGKSLLNFILNLDDNIAIDFDFIAVADDLLPTQVIQFDKDKVKGIVLEEGGITSHCVILAKSLGIPCMINANNIMAKVKESDLLLLDCVNNRWIVNPNKIDINTYEIYKTNKQVEIGRLEQYRNRASITRDGYEIKVFSNISSEAEADALLEQGSEGVGLFRTELFYTSNKFAPTEDFQYETYSQIAKKLGKRDFIIRTLDVGGDKQIPYLNLPKEDNPFLGVRGIRFCLKNMDLFKTQLRAIIRASVYGNIKMMLPMVTLLTEVLQVKNMIRDLQNELGITNKIPLGIMIETPSSAFDAETFAEEVDFFSIGTNDLTQYLFAADRSNKELTYLNSHFQPSLLRMIHHVCLAAHAKNIEVDICGQAGEVIELIPLWVAMGIHNLSVSIPSVTKVREVICGIDRRICSKLLETVLTCKTKEEVIKNLQLGGN
jgi:phosphotransferase system enzyme I (PtsI)